MSYYDTWEERASEADKPHRARMALARAYMDGLADRSLEAIAETAIAILDERHDCDEDHCLAGDEGCGPYWGGPRGGLQWGSAWEGEADLAPFPVYGDDQREIMGPFGVAFRVD